ncbi:MAG TPA: TPM domain-containing protein, partial [Bacteroidota bacterium]|nr:TPM domain-containing protein [Bacteroidota bacterium]
ANKIGRKGKDNGVLLVVARNDRKARIEVGYGLEGVLPDALAGQIIRHEIGPHFRQGDYCGLRAGVEAIMSATKNEYQAEPSSRGGRSSSTRLIFALVFVAFMVIRLARRRHGIFLGGGPWIGGGWGSGSGGGFGGGGFGGGGGSFGGGGASGSW